MLKQTFTFNMSVLVQNGTNYMDMRAYNKHFQLYILVPKMCHFHPKNKQFSYKKHKTKRNENNVFDVSHL